MRKIREIPQNERPREKLLQKGVKNLVDEELLAIILGRGNKKNDVFSLAEKLMKTIDEEGIDFKVKDIMEIDGIGEAKATAISAAFEFVRRRIKPEGIRIKFPADVVPLIQHYGNRKQEHFLCITLNGASEVMNIRVVTIGLLNTCQVHPREVFADVLLDRAAAIIIAHNHPSGNLRPSEEDKNITRRLKESAKILGINLLDHIIFNHKDFYSFTEHGEL